MTHINDRRVVHILFSVELSAAIKIASSFDQVENWKVKVTMKRYLITNSLRICTNPSMEYSHRNVRKMVLSRLGRRRRLFEFSNSILHRLQSRRAVLLSLIVFDCDIIS